MLIIQLLNKKDATCNFDKLDKDKDVHNALSPYILFLQTISHEVQHVVQYVLMASGAISLKPMHSPPTLCSASRKPPMPANKSMNENCAIFYRNVALSKPSGGSMPRNSR